MKQVKKEINEFLVETFNDILKIEESTLKKSPYSNVTMKEFHLLETVYRRGKNNGDNTAGAIAKELRVTPGTLTTAVKLLEKKGYLKRLKDAKDKRSVHIVVTKLGEKANVDHQKFHNDMVEDIISVLSEDESKAFLKGLKTLGDFFEQQDKKIN
ncbi:MAG: MarR family winged helix-turn-helix transcriptional regulator [Clostridiales bacterium]